MISRVVILAASLLCLAVSLNSLLKSDLFLIGSSQIIVFLVIPVLTAIGLLVLARLGHEARLVSAICLLSIVAALLLGEGYFRYKSSSQVIKTAKDVARELGRPHDPRTVPQVVRDMRARGIDTFPNMLPHVVALKGYQSANTDVDLVALGGISRVQTVSCNESGQYLIYESDRHGYNNPDQNWDKTTTEIMLTGDSYGNGSCVQSDRNIAGNLSLLFGNTINLSMPSNGPLIELGTIVEYGSYLKPKYVVWMFTESNDLIDLRKERTVARLLNYLKKNYKQDLKNRQHFVDNNLIKLANSMLKSQYEITSEINTGNNKSFSIAISEILGFLKLRNTRKSLGIEPWQFNWHEQERSRQINHINISMFRQIMIRAKSVVNSWNGRIVIAYLPWKGRYFIRDKDEVYDRVADTVYDIAEKLDIPIIDLGEALTSKGAPRDMYYHLETHLTDKGYARVAEHIAKKLFELEKDQSTN